MRGSLALGNYNNERKIQICIGHKVTCMCVCSVGRAVLRSQTLFIRGLSALNALPELQG